MIIFLTVSGLWSIKLVKILAWIFYIGSSAMLIKSYLVISSF